MEKGKVVFSIHGGAGTIDIPPEKEQAYLYFAKEISHTKRCIVINPIVNT